MPKDNFIIFLLHLGLFDCTVNHIKCVSVTVIKLVC